MNWEFYIWENLETEKKNFMLKLSEKKRQNEWYVVNEVLRDCVPKLVVACGPSRLGPVWIKVVANGRWVFVIML